MMVKMAPIFLLGLIMAFTIQSTEAAACLNTDLSYVIVMDSSSSVLINQPDEWSYEKAFVKKFVAETTYSKTSNVRLGVVNYGQTADVAAGCGSTATSSISNFNTLIDGLVRKEGGTAIHHALEKAIQILAGNGCSRAGEKQLVLLITDGVENVQTNISAIVALENTLRSQAAIHVISVGSGTSISELTRITGNAAYISQYASWEALSQDNATNIYLSFASRVCDVGGRWASWGAYGACSLTCGDVNGIQVRTRKCLNPINNNEQTDCIGAGSESQSCNNGDCQGTLAQWSAYSACSETCHSIAATPPTQTRTRSCQGNSGAGNCGGGILLQTINCNVNGACPGGYSQWSAYGSCSETCQSNVQVPPTQTRTRTCSGGTFGGGCTGLASQTRNCQVSVICQGTLTQWTGYGACSATCQLGISAPKQSRTRMCTGATFGGNCNNEIVSEAKDCNVEVQCPGVLSQWSAFGACSENCQSNTQVAPQQGRTRSCTNFSFGGNCGGAVLTNSASCNINVGCVGQWGAWGTYGTCSETCQSNVGASPTQSRIRSCVGGTFGTVCPGSSTSQQNCNSQVMCQGTLTQWTGYGACSATCQLGISAPKQSRTRVCTGATFGGNCNNAIVSEARDCNVEVQCPGVLSQWSAYGACSESCHSVINSPPKQTRTRTCTGTSFGGNCVNAVLSQQQVCNSGVGCVGQWGAWGAYGACSETCQSNVGLSPSQTRSRNCIGGTFGTVCPGSSTSQQNCNFNVICQGSMTQWTGYAACSATCQLGISAPKQSRTRVCTGATFGGNCNNAIVSEAKDCNVEVQCPGLLSQWSQWSTCPTTCQSGASSPQQFRSRTCTGTSFSGNCGGALLSGTQNCNAGVQCPGILTQWVTWTACSATCQQNSTVPTRRRMRLCQTATLGGNCQGAPLSEVANCNGQVGCPGTLQQWGPWSACTATCQLTAGNVPQQSRQRFCVGSSFGNNCNGAMLSQNQDCNKGALCPVPSSWTLWGQYMTCSKTCDTGSQMRNRTCNAGTPPGPCTGSASETRDCKLVDCPKICPINKRCNCSTITQYSTTPTINQFQITTTEINNAVNVMMYWTEDVQKQACESCVIARLETSVATVNAHIAHVKGITDRLTEIKKKLRDIVNCNAQTTITANLWKLYDWIWERCVMLDGITIELNACKMRFDAALNSCKSYDWFHTFVRHMTRKF